jgi:hypothetical protein
VQRCKKESSRSLLCIDVINSLLNEKCNTYLLETGKTGEDVNKLSPLIGEEINMHFKDLYENYKHDKNKYNKKSHIFNLSFTI